MKMVSSAWHILVAVHFGMQPGLGLVSSIGSSFLELRNAKIAPLEIQPPHDPNSQLVCSGDISNVKEISDDAAITDRKSDSIVEPLDNSVAATGDNGVAGASPNPFVTSSGRITTQTNRTTNKMKETLEHAAVMSNKLRSRIVMCTVGVGIGVITLAALLFFLVKYEILSSETFGYYMYYIAPTPPFGILAVLGLTPKDCCALRMFNFATFLVSVVALLHVLGGIKLWFFDRGNTIMYNDQDSPPPACGSNVPDTGCAVFALYHLILGLFEAHVAWSQWPVIQRVDGVTFYDRTKPEGHRFNDAAFKTPARESLQKGWSNSRYYLVSAGTVNIIFGLIFHLLGDDYAPFFDNDAFASRMLVGFSFLSCGVATTVERRRRIIAFIGSMVSASEVRSAASIAALLGDIDPTKGLELAKEKFHAIPFQVLEEDHFATNRERQEEMNSLFEQTLQIALGSCDAFLSHSWNDDGPQKYHALRRWAEQFHRENDRHPNLWLDKACINQMDIANDLLCLPIFLAGCNELLIIAGRTYTTRLWCILEVFVFLQMGGDIERITILPINHDENLDKKHIFNKVDVREAECFKKDDQDRLMDIILEGFGDYDEFNEVVRHVFKEQVTEIHSVKSKAYRSSRQQAYQPTDNTATTESQ